MVVHLSQAQTELWPERVQDVWSSSEVRYEESPETVQPNLVDLEGPKSHKEVIGKSNQLAQGDQ
jgi:hypothetical protein